MGIGGEGMKQTQFGLFVAASFLLLFLASAGCLSAATVRDTSAGVIHAHYETQDSWSFGYGCYTHLTGFVYNAGNSSEENLKLDFNLVNTGTGTIRDSRSIFIGNLEPGQTRTFETILDGDCSQDYRVDFSSENQ